MKPAGDPHGRISPSRPWWKPPCSHRKHEPPHHIASPPEGFTHVCPGCGERVTVYPPRSVV